jgi:hypothetical protein
MKAPQEILDLVARFDQNLEAYQSGKYNETQIRREFIDPFFKALAGMSKTFPAMLKPTKM